MKKFNFDKKVMFFGSDNPPPSVVYITEDCLIKEDGDYIKITEPSGKEHFFPKGSYVFSKRCDMTEWLTEKEER